MPVDDYLPDLHGATPVARIGLISDTHAPQRCPELPSPIFDAFDGVDLILHGGDVGELSVLDRLGDVAPVVAVFGNDETHEARAVLPQSLVVHVGGVRVLLVHSHKLDPAEEAAARQADDWPTILDHRRRLADGTGADVVVFGHLHVPMAVEREGVLLVNPGVVGHSHVVYRSTVRSVALLFIADAGLRVVHVDAETGKAFQPDVDWDGGYWATMERINESIVHPSLGPWREVWRAMRAIEPNATFAALLTHATECWTGRAEWITRESLLETLANDDRVDQAMLRDFEIALT